MSDRCPVRWRFRFSADDKTASSGGIIHANHYIAAIHTVFHLAVDPFESILRVFFSGITGQVSYADDRIVFACRHRFSIFSVVLIVCAKNSVICAFDFQTLSNDDVIEARRSVFIRIVTFQRVVIAEHGAIWRFRARADADDHAVSCFRYGFMTDSSRILPFRKSISSDCNSGCISCGPAKFHFPWRF